MKPLRWTLALSLCVASCGGEVAHPLPPSDPVPASSRPTADPAPLLARWMVTKSEVDAKGFSHSAAVLSEVIGPLTEACANPATSAEMRSKIVEALAPTNDKRAMPCVEVVVGTLEAATRDASKHLSESSARAALGFVAAVPDPKFHDAVFSIFESDARFDGAKRLREPLRSAVVAVARGTDVAKLVGLVERPLPATEDEGYDDELFRQSTAIAALELREDVAVIPPLVRVILSPRKIELHASALVSLSRVSVPATAALVKLIRGEDASQQAFAEAHALDFVASDARTPALIALAKTAHLVRAAETLSALGRTEGVGPVMEAMDKADPTTKALLALTLPGFPPSALTTTVFRKATEATGLEVSLPNGSLAKPALLRASLRFYDPSMVHWILQTAKAQKGKPERVDEVRSAALSVATRLMRTEHVKLVLELSSLTRLSDPRRTLGTPAETVAGELVSECKSDAACYANVAIQPVTSDRARLRAEKSVALQLALSPADAATALMKLLPRLEDPAVVSLASDALTRALTIGSNSFSREVEALAKVRLQKKKPDATDLALSAAKLRARAAR